MPYTGKITRDALREALTTRYDKPSRNTQILLGDEIIGRVVTYGKKDTLRVPKNGLRPTVFNGRIDVDGIRLSIEASNTGSLLNAIATKLGQELRKARKPEPTAVEEAAASAATSGFTP